MQIECDKLKNEKNKFQTTIEQHVQEKDDNKDIGKIFNEKDSLIEEKEKTIIFLKSEKLKRTEKYIKLKEQIKLEKYNVEDLKNKLELNSGEKNNIIND